VWWVKERTAFGYGYPQKEYYTFRQEVILVSARPFERRFYLALVVLKVVECESRDIKHRRALQRIRHANAFDKHGSQINVDDTIPIWLEWPCCGLLSLCQRTQLCFQSALMMCVSIHATSYKKGFTNQLSCICRVKVKSIAHLFKMQTKE